MALSKSIQARANRRAAVISDALRGKMPSLLRFSSRSQLELVVTNPIRLPVQVDESLSALQNSFQQRVYIEGYSMPGGPDAGAPPGP